MFVDWCLSGSRNVSVIYSNVPKLSSLWPKVCCWFYGVRLGCGLGVGPNFSLCDGLGWVGSAVWWVGLG